MVTIADNVTAKAIAPMTMPTSTPVRIFCDSDLVGITARITSSMRTVIYSQHIQYTLELNTASESCNL